MEEGGGERAFLALSTSVPAAAPSPFDDRQVVGVANELARFVVGAVVIIFYGSIEWVVDHLPPVPGLVRTVRFAEGAIG